MSLLFPVSGSFYLYLVRPMVSLSGPRGAHIDCSNGWKSLKQKPSFLLGLSMTWHEVSSIVPTQWLLFILGLLYSSNSPGFRTHHSFVHDFKVPRTYKRKRERKYYRTILLNNNNNNNIYLHLTTHSSAGYYELMHLFVTPKTRTDSWSV